MSKHIKYLIAVAVMVLITAGPSLAHKVSIFAYAEDGKIYTESYFSDGKPAINGKVLVFDSQKQKVMEGVTDKEGLFNFDIPKVDDLEIVINASMGHKDSFKLKKAEVEAGK